MFHILVFLLRIVGLEFFFYLHSNLEGVQQSHFPQVRLPVRVSPHCWKHWSHHDIVPARNSLVHVVSNS